VRQPKVFLFDEPLSNLDAKMRVQMRAEIIKLHQRLQATMIYVTHDQVEAMTMGDRIVVMKAGVIQQIDTPLALYRKPVNRFVAGFLGSPAMNFIPGTLKESAGLLVFNEAPPGVIELTVTSRPELLPFVGREIVAGVRPEDVVVVRGEEPAMLQLYVDIVEQMGAEANIHLNSRAHILLCRTSPAADGIKAGDKIGCEIAPGKVHLFDPETTCRIVGGSKSS
jgi:multiple sugar transport system ATP-binding protein